VIFSYPGIQLAWLFPRYRETAEEDFKRLEREIDELREANHILKKAMGFLVGRVSIPKSAFLGYKLSQAVK